MIFVWVLVAFIIGELAYRQGYINSNDLIYFCVLIPSVILHEISHGALAYLYGDNTAKNAGRLTLNPLRHVDVYGTFIIPLVLLFTVHTAFGYAKPVPVNVAGMSRNKSMMTGLIGPITNIVIALLAAGVINLIYPSVQTQWIYTVLVQLGRVNVVLAVFNLIPIPPLDGSAVVERFLPARHLMSYYRVRQYSMIILMLLVLMGRGVIGSLFTPFINEWFKLLPS